MSTNEANLSAFAAYNLTPNKGRKAKQNAKAEKGSDTLVREFLDDEIKKFTSNERLTSPLAPKQLTRNRNKKDQNVEKAAKGKAKGMEPIKKAGNKKTNAKNQPPKENLNFTNEFSNGISNLQASTPSNGTNGKQNAKRKYNRKQAKKEVQPEPILVEEDEEVEPDRPNKKSRKLSEQQPKKSPKRDLSDGIQTPVRPKPESSANLIVQSQKPSLEEFQRNGSIAMAKQSLKWIIDPVQIDEFKTNYWEKAPICVNRNAPNHYTQLLSTEIIDKMLRENHIEFTKNIDITSYENGVRETHNPEGRALPPAVWSFYRDGCSIRLLNPQTFIPQIHELNATLQEYFHCMTGANVYLTPPNSQGFAPHYDDIEAFVLQIEGKKLWRLYAPRSENEFLPRVSSGNFKPDEIGKPILERTLEAGDLMYFPRGTIHQAQTVPGHHSLHITLSVYQKTCYGDLLEILIPNALEKAINSDIEFRRGLPLNIWGSMGLVNGDEETTARSYNISVMKNLFAKIIEHADFDAAVDQMALKYQHDALPPVITPAESNLTVYGSKCKLTAKGEMEDLAFKPETNIRLLRANILRLVVHENTYRVYFYTDNSKEYHEYEPNYIELDGDMAPAVEYLIKSYPHYISVSDLPLEPDQNLDITFELWNRGLIMTEKPLE